MLPAVCPFIRIQTARIRPAGSATHTFGVRISRKKAAGLKIYSMGSFQFGAECPCFLPGKNVK
jgi:hypothetical protein